MLQQRRALGPGVRFCTRTYRWRLLGMAWAAIAWFASAQLPASSREERPLTAILGAMAAEVQVLEKELQGKRSQSFLGITFRTGVLRGRRVVLAQCGIGKVNAAMTTAVLLDRFAPTEVIFTGVAGALNPSLAPGDLLIAEKIAQHDYGEIKSGLFHPQPTPNPATGQPNPHFFPASEPLIRLAEQAAKEVAWAKLPTSMGERFPVVTRGTIVTGDVFVACPQKSAELRRLFQADAVEMEGAAVAQVCWQRNVPFLVIRCMSDRADVTAVEDFQRFLQVAANNSARLALHLVELLAKRPPRPRSE